VSINIGRGGENNAERARIVQANAYYHIVNRGNQKQEVFLENDDFARYLQLLKHFKRKYTAKLYGYCLMPNHVHLILTPKDPAELARFVQCLTQTYTSWFNNKYKKTAIYGKVDTRV